MRYELIGPLRIICDGEARVISARKIEILLAALVIRADQLVSADRLIAEIWGEHPPRRAIAGLRVYVSELRKFLARADPGGERILTRPPGYVLQLGSDETDVQRFVDLLGEGRAHARAERHQQAADRFERALRLWRGPALGDLPPGPVAEAFVTWISEARMECTELLIESELRLGRHRELVGRISALASEFPLREGLYRQLMLALYRCERRADALQVYQSARRTLDAELGLEPSRSLRDLQRAILDGDERLLGVRTGP